MKWLGGRESSNVEDDRGITGGHVAAGGGVIGLIIYIIYSLMGGSGPSGQAPQLPGQTQSAQQSPEDQAAEDREVKFVKVVLGDTEDVWTKLFADEGKTYQYPTLVLFRDEVQSACGFASAAAGPFYCPGDRKLYLDLSFCQELKDRFKAPGDFAVAYVIAHEVGHHIQNLKGISAKMEELHSQLDKTAYNKYSVKLELQADFLAGVWAHYADKMQNIIEPGDIESALSAANAIGDDRLQRQATGTVVPDAFTHGTSAQRVYWFKKGYETGDLKQGDTFHDPSLN
ncbi:MAG: neutral zinc metallopeptidase [Bacteroidota bacterium]|nr:neutral zinc metallopeptidase [Bacteroidota bacterium]MDP4216796.1 neutral zinc metallopeptidase [Bacteroidota bacterium]MDP4248264.1 neutral zinc metallopeptidase [Bacteroidota bacterium]MDP4259743.1 neutral zinc metallopeptidase [Bacteroidota bacterium]